MEFLKIFFSPIFLKPLISYPLQYIFNLRVSIITCLRNSINLSSTSRYMDVGLKGTGRKRKLYNIMRTLKVAKFSHTLPTHSSTIAEMKNVRYFSI